ncbi:MAG: hypothetical protein Q8N05_18665 [Bacteroidota bacterium]|nr:hypothetical protein [Bacteroidota bacterium]
MKNSLIISAGIALLILIVANTFGTSYPSLIFVNGNGEIVAQTAGYHNPQEFIELGKQVIKK